MVKQAELEALVLFALYNYFQKNSDQLSIGEVARLLDGDIPEGRVRMALGVLEERGLTMSSRVIVSGQIVKYWLTDEGYKHAEELAERSDDKSDDELESAPAADRIVGFDHNSSEFREILQEADKLESGLGRPNDAGEMSPRAVTVAHEEVGFLKRLLKSDFLRPSHVWRAAKSTLKWIGEQAAGAVVGQVALGLLALIAALFGFSLL